MDSFVVVVESWVVFIDLLLVWRAEELARMRTAGWVADLAAMMAAESVDMELALRPWFEPLGI